MKFKIKSADNSTKMYFINDLARKFSDVLEAPLYNKLYKSGEFTKDEILSCILEVYSRIEKYLS